MWNDFHESQIEHVQGAMGASMKWQALTVFILSLVFINFSLTHVHCQNV